jgi:outer membrane protein OmpA-like peptidoglycan-associated protein
VGKGLKRINIRRVFKAIAILAVMFLYSNTSVFSQNKKAIKGVELYKADKYVAAIEHLKKAREENDSSYLIIKNLANCYRKLRQYENAELYYLLTVNSDSSIAEDHLYYGQALKANGKLAAAKDQFQKFSDLNSNDFLGNIMLQSIDEIESWEEQPKEFIINSENNLNSPFSEYGLHFFNNKVLFTSNRDKNENSPESSASDETPFYSIYEFNKSELKTEGEGKVKESSGLINTIYHDGPLTINEQEDRLIITRIDNQMRGRDFVNRRKLYQAENINGKWKKFEPLPFNSDDYSVCHAHLADSGNTLFFASNMPGGIGGYDIYECKWVDNAWTTPINLGLSINTKKNELFPYKKNDVLYFSSDGFPGYGGLDILFSEYNNTWQAPENLKSPINSSRDDFSIYFITDTSGYYASNRDGGKGDDDLYKFIKTVEAQLVDINGLYEFKGLPMDSVKVMLINEKDSVISIEYTDHNGQFKFVRLPYNHEYLVKIDEEDEDIVKDGRLFLTDEYGNKLQLLNRIKNGDFVLKALPVDEYKRIALMEEQDSDIIGDFRFLGQLYKKLPGDYTQKKMVYLISPDGDIIDSVYSDKNGHFNFEKLNGSSDLGYIVRLKEEDPELNLALENSYGRIYEIIEADGNGLYSLSNSLDASLRKLEAKNKGKTSLLAKIEHRGLPLKLIKVNIYDNAKNYLSTVYTNEAGEFQFNSLDFDEVFLIGLPELDEDILYKSLVYVLDENGDPLYLINQLKDGLYEFKALPFDEYKLIQQEEEAYVPHVIKIAGQIYKKLPGDYNEGIEVYVLDSDGNIIDSVYTDANGKFKFEKLASDKNYTFRLKGEEAVEDFNLALLDAEDRLLEVATINNRGNFTYKKLTYQVAQFEPIEEVDVQIIEDIETHEIMGQVYQKLPGDFQSGMKVFVYDEDGNLLGITETDESGKFHFKKLQKDKNYFFKIEDEDDHFQLVTVDEFDRVIDKTVKNVNGQFKYKSLSLDEHKLLLAEERDHNILDFNYDKISLDDIQIHYRFDSVEVRPIEKPKLNKIIETYKNLDYVIEVHSYTDNRGSPVYNQYLSKVRTDKVIRYLSRRGFPREKIIGNYSGELNPVVDCETKECDNDDHYLNRRTEFKLIKSLDK